MPEGPEVRKYADALDEVLAGRQIKHFMARTVKARKWLEQNGSSLLKRKVTRVLSHGKHLIGYIDGDYYFHSQEELANAFGLWSLVFGLWVTPKVLTRADQSSFQPDL
ncbi:MAG TPA: DNA-formamidopyrimidine glycosylase family protein [Pyrinomonadaceae bacterium]|nr:DNA-formamidopyrimidine glycosylase family protein [Pyrinomonadaceae bacterium]